MADDRLTALDASFLMLEDGSNAHMHVAAVMLFEDHPPAYADLLAAIERRLHLVPRYRQKLHYPPLPIASPEWVDDPHFSLEYHVRHTALPHPGSEQQLRNLAGRLLSQRLDRSRPLWELWLVEGLAGGGFALISKTHHALVDGISGVDILTVLFDAERRPHDAREGPKPWVARPAPPPAQSLAGAVTTALRIPAGAARSAVSLAGRPTDLSHSARTFATGLSGLMSTALRPAPPSPYNVPIGPHRRFAWVRATLDEVKFVKNTLGGTVNDVVLAAVTGALRRHLQGRGEEADVELVAMVPVSVRGDAQRGLLGNRVSSMFASLPIDAADARARLIRVSEEMNHLKQGGQAVGAQMLTELGGLAPPTVMAQAARIVAGPRTFNLTVTNVPGPQLPLYVTGRQMEEMFPMVPLAPGHALGIAILSYNGRLGFGLVGDWEAMADIDDLATDLRAELDDLVAAARGTEDGAGSKRRPARRRSRVT